MNSSSSYILFVDHEGHVAPLGLCYHATASRRLSSSIERHPPSTITEIDSAYCPHCLAVHDVASASRLGFCPKPSCQQCPKCFSVLNIIIDDSKRCFYTCGYCDWNSSETLATECADESQIDASVEALGMKLNESRESKKKEEDATYDKILDSLEAFAVEELRRVKRPSHLYHQEKSRDWNMKALITSIDDRKKNMSSKEENCFGIGTHIPEPSEEFTKIIESSTVTSLLLSPPSELQPYQLPLPMPLHPRKSRRCRAELREGRPGILVKPKLNPLEGDTSLRSGHGQWFKKDSSAVLVVPRVSVQSLQDNVVLLRVHNPTLGNVELSFGPSSYSGEPTWDGDTTKHWTDVLVDSLSGKRLAEVTLDTSFQLPVSDIITLQAVEDTFLEMGGRGTLPPEVSNWNGELGWIAQKSDKAWFGFQANSSNCIALTMIIKIAKGSWESSLVKLSGDKDDTVRFDMVLIRDFSDK